jgi:hypothetical protein
MVRAPRPGPPLPAPRHRPVRRAGVSEKSRGQGRAGVRLFVLRFSASSDVSTGRTIMPTMQLVRQPSIRTSVAGFSSAAISSFQATNWGASFRSSNERPLSFQQLIGQSFPDANGPGCLEALHSGGLSALRQLACPISPIPRQTKNVPITRPRLSPFHSCSRGRGFASRRPARSPQQRRGSPHPGPWPASRCHRSSVNQSGRRSSFQNYFAKLPLWYVRSSRNSTTPTLVGLG